ncbi:MAG: patatin-like phospholipase family protein, partial [Phaeodactylibacter sp.]|nr:patatin-like phospholipase family protein [Phaeodactylibacter sp.]
KIGLVLGSGGLKPIASIALFDFLRSEQIELDLIVGCSGGSIYAAMYSMGYSTDEMIEFTRRFLENKGFGQIDYRTVLSVGKLPGGQFDLSRGILKDQAPLEMCQEVFKNVCLEDLPVRTLLQATDLQSGQGVVLEQGALAECVYGSAAMYPLLPPIFLQGRCLADGAFTAPLPITEAVKQGADLIISMLFHEKMVSSPRRFIDTFYNVNRIYGQALAQSQLSLAIDLHHYETILVNTYFEEPIPFSDPAYIEAVLEEGQRAVAAQRDEILRAIENFQHLNH